jgi:hypothetical protein
VSRGLIQFSGITLPDEATFSGATLMLTRTGGGNATAYTTYAHRGLVQWYEGAYDGTDTQGNDGSSWNYRNQNNSQGWQAWTGGTGGASGTEWTADATGSVSVEGNGAYDITVTADVLAWLTGTANYGWWLLGAEAVAGEYKTFASSDNAAAGSRPILSIVYTLPSASAMVRAPGWGRW